MNAHINDVLSSKSGTFFSQPLCLTNVLRYPTMASRVENSMAIAVPVPSTKPLQFLAAGSNNTKQPLIGKFFWQPQWTLGSSITPAFVWVAFLKPSSRAMKGKMVLWENTSPSKYGLEKYDLHRHVLSNFSKGSLYLPQGQPLSRTQYARHLLLCAIFLLLLKLHQFFILNLSFRNSGMSGRKVKLLLVHCFPLLASLKSQTLLVQGTPHYFYCLDSISGGYTALS